MLQIPRPSRWFSGWNGLRTLQQGCGSAAPAALSSIKNATMASGGRWEGAPNFRRWQFANDEFSQVWASLAQPHLIDSLTSFRYGNHRISNFEMETSAIYGLGKMLGHYCLSLSAIVANRIAKEFSKDGNAAVEKLIEKTLEIVGKIS